MTRALAAEAAIARPLAGVRVAAEDVTRQLGEGPGGTRWMPVGGGTLLGRGALPAEPLRLLDLSGRCRIVEHAAEDLTVTVEAGVAVARLQAALGEAGQWIPVAAAGDPRSTVGGWIAADRRSPLAGAWGSVRDYLLGITFVTGAGETVRAGGRVVKNVAGYDLMKMMVGSLGEFGVILEATLKVLPRPRTWGGLLLETPPGHRGSPERESHAIRLGPAGWWRFDLGEGEREAMVFAGPEARVEAQIREARARMAGGGRALGPAEVAALLERLEEATRPGPHPVAWGGALPASLTDVDAALLSGDPGHPSRWIADLLRGHLWISMPAAFDLRAVRSALRVGVGHLHLDAPPAHAYLDPWDDLARPEVPLWRGIQATLDPRGRLVRGRLPGGV